MVKIFLRVIVLLVIAGFCYCLELLRQDLWCPMTSQGPLTVVVQKGALSRDLLHVLMVRGHIVSPFLHHCFLKATVWDRHIQAGVYQIDHQQSLMGLYHKLVMGQQHQYALTIPEGLTTNDIKVILQNTPFLSGKNPEIKPHYFLFPDTYFLSYNTLRKRVVQRLKKAGRRTINRLWQEKPSYVLLKKPSDLLTLASIVEKEAAIPEERTFVACVFLNRLHKNMLLQACPTVIYSLSLQGKTYKKRLTEADLKVKSAYNTYLYKGLPPGPICHPGLGALKAVLHPHKSNDLYFVATGSGRHIFSKTYLEHKLSKPRWHRKRKRQNHKNI